MSDDKNNRGSQDRNRISLTEDYEVRHWTEALGVSREELEEAVKSVGNSAQKVREHFSNRKGSSDK
jgi:pyrroloquinoline quinone (PQQ) biosynthesis protein C